MTKGTFKKLGESTKPMYGPRAILISGFASLEQEKVMELLNDIQFTDIPVIFATAEDADKHLNELFARPDQSGRNEDSNNARAIIISGITEKELQQLLFSYKKSGLPRPLWATLTPFSEKWTLCALLDELKKERIAMGKK